MKEEVAPAMFIFKRHNQIMNDLTDREAGKIWKALFKYVLTKEEPKDFPRDLRRYFLIFKEDIDVNEERYLAKRQRNKADYEKRKEKTAQKEVGKPPEQPETEVKPTARGKPAREPTSQKTTTSKASEDDLAKLQKSFLTAFKTYLPDKEINCKLSDFPDVDLEALMFAIRESPQFLMNPKKNKGFKGLRWYLENAKNIIAGAYVKFDSAEKPKAKQDKTNVYTDEQMKEIYGKVKVFGEDDHD